MATTWDVTGNAINIILVFSQHKAEHISLRIGPLLGKIFYFFE